MNDMQSVQDMVMLAGDQVMTDSRKVAQHFGKRHRDVLRSVRKLLADMPPSDRQRNFAQTVETRINPSGGGEIGSPVYQMTKDGFLLLVMGFTGKQALAIKLAFIEAFNRMAEFIRTQAMGEWERFNAAYLDFRHDRDHASRCGTDLNRWRRKKADHLHRLERLDPQIKLPMTA